MKHLTNAAPFKVGDMVWFLDDSDEADPSYGGARVAKEHRDGRMLVLCDFHPTNPTNLKRVAVENAWHTLNEAQLAVANRLRRQAFKMRLRANDNIRRAKLFEKDARIGEAEQLADWQERLA